MMKGIATMRISGRILAAFLGILTLFTAPLAAQDRMWLQIEAQPNLNTALDRARAYASLFADVEGYKLGNGWYGIALGPQSTEAAGARLLDLRRQNLIPADSYLADGTSYGQRFWPVGAEDATPTTPALPEVAALPETVEPVVAPAPEPEETLKHFFDFHDKFP